MTNKITLEQLLRMQVKAPRVIPGSDTKYSPDFRVAVQEVTNDGVRIIIHPHGHDGETLDFVVTGNELRLVR